MKFAERVRATSHGVGEVLAAARNGLANGLRSGFPDLAEYLQDYSWVTPQDILEFPKACALIPTVYACVNRIAGDMASLRPTFYTGEGPTRIKLQRKPNNIVDLWRRANPQQTGYEMERDRQFTLDINGNGYLYLERFGTNGPPLELWVLQGHLTRPVPGPRRSVEYYEFGLYRNGVRLETENVIPFHYANPDWDPLEPSPVGLSPLQACQASYETRFSMANWQREFFTKGAQVAHVFNVKEGTKLDDAKAKAMQESLDRRYSGAKNRFKPVLVQGMEILRAGLTHAEMMYLETSQLTDSDICRVYGIPPSDMGVTENKSALSQGGSETRSLAYWQNCIIPRVTLRDEVLNEWLCPLFGSGINCETDFSSVFAVQNARLDGAKAHVILCGRPIFTVNQVLEKLGEPISDDPEADKLYVPMKPLSGMPQEQATPAPEATTKASRSRAEIVAELVEALARPIDEAPATKALTASRPAKQLELAVNRKKRLGADLARYERKAVAEVRAHFTRQEGVAIDRLKRQAHNSGMPLDSSRKMKLSLNPDELVDSSDPDEQAALQALFDALVAERGEAAAAEIGLEISLTDQAAKWVEKVKARVDRMIALTDETTRKALNDSLSEGLGVGESFSSLAARVRQIFDDRRANALTIARTETAWAYNAAAFDVWKDGGVEMKEWVTVHDDAVREEHQAVEDAGPIPMDEPFLVAGLPAMFPGETGDPSMDCNCRCVCQPYFAEVSALDSSSLDSLFRDPAPSLNGHGNHNRLSHFFEGVA